MIPLYKPFMPDLPDMLQVLNSGLLAYGAHTREFEDKLKKYFNTDYIVTTNSFNTAISVAITSLGLSFGDEIIASPMACLASTQPYLSAGLKIVWADVDNKSGTLDPKSVEEKITSETKAIIHNHFCGYPGYIDEINAIGKKYGISVIDDGIECFGSEYKNKKIGNCGTDISVFSFNAVRIPNTIDGGAVIFKDKKAYQDSLLIRDCGIDRKIFRDDLGEINPNCDINKIGFSATMSNVNGYIGSMQMDIVHTLINKQRLNAAVWDNRLFDKGYKIIESDNCNPNYWVYGILVEDKLKEIKFFREKGFYASGIHINNNIYSVFGKSKTLPGVDDFYSHFVALPCGWWIDDLEQSIK